MLSFKLVVLALAHKSKNIEIVNMGCAMLKIQTSKIYWFVKSKAYLSVSLYVHFQLDRSSVLYLLTQGHRLGEQVTSQKSLVAVTEIKNIEREKILYEQLNVLARSDIHITSHNSLVNTCHMTHSSLVGLRSVSL